MPAYPGFGGPSYQSRSLTVDCERCLNLYPEIVESGQGSGRGQRFALYGTPGKFLAGAVGPGAGAALIPGDTFGFPDNSTIIWYAVVGNKLYSIAFEFTSAGNPSITPTLIGTVASRAFTNGQLFPAQIILLGDKWLFVVAAGQAFVAAFGAPISASALAAAAPIGFSTLNAGGTGYVAGDTGTIDGGSMSAQYVVLTVDGGGGVLTYRLTDPGEGYATAIGVTTTAGGAQPGAGTGFTIDITATSGGSGYAVGDTGRVAGGKSQAFYAVLTVDANGSVLTYSLSLRGAGYAAANGVATSTGGTQPGAGVGLSLDITAVGAAGWSIAQQTIGGILASDVFINFATWMDGYVIASPAPNTLDSRRQRFYISGLNDPTTWSLLAFGTKEGNPDPVVGPFAAYENLLVFGTQTTEIWYDSGDLNFPFTRVQMGGLLEAGCASPWSIQKMDGTVMWLGKDARGTNICWQLRGLTPVRVSNHAIETRWKDFTGEYAIAYVHQMGGHYFYVLTFPIEDQTWVYDSSTGQWHERGSEDSDLVLHADFGRYGAYGSGIGTGVLDYRNGNFYMLDIGYWDEAGIPILRERVAPPLVDDDNWAFYSQARLLSEQGNPAASDGFLGPLPTATPEYTLEISRDGGQSWEDPLDATGSATDTTALIEWWALGRARQFAARLRSRSPINHAWSNFFLKVQKGRDF